MKQYQLLKQEKHVLEEMLHELVFRDCSPKKIKGGWLFTVPIQGVSFQVAMTEDELNGVIVCAVDIMEEFKKIYNSGMDQEAFEQVAEEERKKAESLPELFKTAVIDRIATPVLNETIEKIRVLMRVGGIYDMFISRPKLMSVLYAVYERMAGYLEEEIDIMQALYFLLRGIMQIASEPEQAKAKRK